MTVIPQFEIEDIVEAAKEIRGAKIFYLQPYVDHGMGLPSPTKEFLNRAKDACKDIVNTEVR